MFLCASLAFHRLSVVLVRGTAGTLPRAVCLALPPATSLTPAMCRVLSALSAKKEKRSCHRLHMLSSAVYSLVF